MPLKKVTLYKTSVVAFKQLQASLLKSNFRIVSSDSLYQILYVRREESLLSRFLTFKIKMVGIGDKTNITIEPNGLISSLFKFERHYLLKASNELERILRES